MKNITWLVLFTAILLGGCTKEAITSDETAARNSTPDKNNAGFFKRTRTVQTSDYNEVFTIPCTNDGMGEDVSIIGKSELVTETIQMGPIRTVITLFKLKNASGTGAATEKLYNANCTIITTQVTSSKDSRYSYDYDEKLTVLLAGTTNGLARRMIVSQSVGSKGNVIKPYKVQETNDCN